jgi:hypothetical protein
MKFRENKKGSKYTIYGVDISDYRWHKRRTLSRGVSNVVSREIEGDMFARPIVKTIESIHPNGVFFFNSLTEAFGSSKTEGTESIGLLVRDMLDCLGSDGRIIIITPNPKSVVINDNRMIYWERDGVQFWKMFNQRILTDDRVSWQSKVRGQGIFRSYNFGEGEFHDYALPLEVFTNCIDLDSYKVKIRSGWSYLKNPCLPSVINRAYGLDILKTKLGELVESYLQMWTVITIKHRTG